MMANTEGICIGCGEEPVVQVNDRKLCGNCFLLGISVSLQSASQPEIVSGNGGSTDLGDLRSTLLTAIDEIQRLRHRLDDLVRENARLRKREE